MEKKKITVIGGGPAGYTAAIRVSQLGGKATLINDNDIGGTCLNRGCIPIKALATATELIDLARSARDYGVNFPEPGIDFSRMIARKDTIVKIVVSGVKMLLEGNGVEVINGTGEFLSPSELVVKLSDGTRKDIKADQIIIASGSRCQQVSVPARVSEKVINTTQALELKEIPKSILILGAGFIGLTFATIFSRLGANVTVIEPSTQVLVDIDREIFAIFEKELRKRKIQIHAGIQVKEIAEGNFPAEYLLTTGREANTDGLGLDKINVGLNDKGGIAVNQRLETTAPNIYAAGDVTMQHPWTPVAFAEGIVAAENAMGKKSEIDYAVLPRWANTSPEIAGVGITEAEAIARGYQVRVGKFPFAANSVATIMGQRTGMVKMITEAKYGQILGVHITGPQAANLIAEAALAMKLEATPENIGLTMHGHPSLFEALWEAAKDVTGETIHFISQNKK
jgi:dihydrolipoamide dehydrogenase